MCMACEMEAMWFAAMEARARAVAAEAVSQATLPSPLEMGRVGEEIAGDTHGARGESDDPFPRDNSQGELRGPPPEEGGGGTAPSRFACEETQAE
jgi:hypothetical protein